MTIRKIMLSALNKFSTVLVWARYRNKADAFKKLNEILPKKKTNFLKKENGIILITPLRISPMSNLFEALIGKFYQIKGHEVKYLLCNQTVNVCENMNKMQNSMLTCALCMKEQKRFKKFVSSDIIKANDFLSREARKKIKAEINSRNFKQKDDFVYNGVNLYEPILAGVMRYTLRSDISGDEHLIKNYAETAFIYSEVLSTILKEMNISKVITSHGIYSSWGSILETAKARGIEAVVWGRGYIGQGKLLFARNENLQNEFANEGKAEFSELELNLDQIQGVNEYFKSKRNPKSGVDYVNYYNNLKVKVNSELDIEMLKKYSKIFGMFTNIPWDGEMLKTTEHFPTTRDFVKTVFQWFSENTDCLLIIRAHPAEATRIDGKGTEKFSDLLSELYPILPSNVIFLPPESSITSYEVSKVVDAVILFGSTMSLELAIENKIVLQTGLNNVTNKNIVYDCLTKDEFYTHLKLVKNGELNYSDEMKNNALKYSYYWINQRHISDSTVQLSKLVFQNFNFSNEKDFMSNSMLGFVYNKIENKEKVKYE